MSDPHQRCIEHYMRSRDTSRKRNEEARAEMRREIEERICVLEGEDDEFGRLLAKEYRGILRMIR